MTLKKEFIEIITTILKTHDENNKDEKYPLLYDMIENTELRLLPEHEYINAVYWDSESGEMGEVLRIPVDLELHVSDFMDGRPDYVCFNKKPEYRGWIVYINTYKELMYYMKSFIKRLEERTQIYKNYAKNVIELQDYAVEFAEQVKKEFPVFTDINSKMIPISFHPDYSEDDKEVDYMTSGNFCWKRAEMMIHIYCCSRYLDELKKTLRHEILHYMLWRMGLNYSDDSLAFMVLADKYDAHPYGALSDTDQEIYETWRKMPADKLNMFMVGNSSNLEWKRTSNKVAKKVKRIIEKAFETENMALLDKAMDVVASNYPVEIPQPTVQL